MMMNGHGIKSVRPFHDPLSQDYIKGELSGMSPVYTLIPDDYFGSLRYYLENEAPGEWFDPQDSGWSWQPEVTPIHSFHSAINKQVI